MTLLTEATGVFAAAEGSGPCVVAFLCKRRPSVQGRESEKLATTCFISASEQFLARLTSPER